MTEAVGVDAEEARRLRHAMTDELVKLERITSPAVDAAFRTVPHEQPGLR